MGLHCQDLLRPQGGPPGEGGRAGAPPAAEDPEAADTSHREEGVEERAVQLLEGSCLSLLRCPRTSSLRSAWAPMGPTGSHGPSEVLAGERARVFLTTWLQLGASYLRILTRGEPQGDPPTGTAAAEAAAAEAAAGNPEASEALGGTWGDTWGLFPVKLQPWLVRVLGPYCLTNLIGALRLALSKKDLGLPTLPLPRKSAEERLGRFRGRGGGRGT